MLPPSVTVSRARAARAASERVVRELLYEIPAPVRQPGCRTQVVGQEVGDAGRGAGLPQVAVHAQVVEVCRRNRPVGGKVEQHVRPVVDVALVSPGAGGALNPAAQGVVLVTDTEAAWQSYLRQLVLLVPTVRRRA